MNIYNKERHECKCMRKRSSDLSTAPKMSNSVIDVCQEPLPTPAGQAHSTTGTSRDVLYRCTWTATKEFVHPVCLHIVGPPSTMSHQDPWNSPASQAKSQATSKEDHHWRTGRLQSRKERNRADLQPMNPLWEISPAPARPLPCLHRLQEGLRQGLACSFAGNHEHKPCLSHHTSQERQPAAVPELPNSQPHQSPMQSHAEDHTEQTEATSGEDHRQRTGRLRGRRGLHRADLQPTLSMWKISPALARPLPCLRRLQEGLLQGFACNFVGNHEEVQHQHKPYPSHQKPL